MSLESEQATVASAIQSAEQYDTVSEIICSDDFTDETMKCIWDANAAMREQGKDVDMVSLAALLDRSHRWQLLNIGESFPLIVNLTESARSLKSATVYADIVKSASTTRKIFSYSESVKEVAHSDLDSDEKLGQVHSMLAPLTDSVPDGFSDYRGALLEAVASITAQMERGGGLSGLSTGFDALDEITAGLHDSELVIVGARPSMGKTVLAMCIANHVAQKDPVLVFSLEMPKQMLAKRSLSSFAKIHMNDLMRGNIKGHQSGLLQHAGQRLTDLNMRIDDSAGLTVDQLRTRVRIAARKEKPRLVVIDYLTLLKGKGDNMHLEVSYISKSLKAMAKEQACPVICLAQLNRGLEQRPDKRPKLSDLRESGSIEEDADVVMFLYRDEVYDKESERKGILEVGIAKNRNGETGTRYLKSELQYQRFSELDSVVPEITKKQNQKPLANILSGGSNAAMNHVEGF